jgi:hypothetical protein
MRATPALLVLTLAASTASVAAPVITLPGGHSAHAVAPRITEVPLAAADLTGVAGRLLGPTDLTAAFSLVGVTWDRSAQPGDGPDLSLRTRRDGVWTPWTALDVDDDGPDGAGDPAELAANPQAAAAAPRLGTAPLWVGPSDGFQLRLDRIPDHLPTGLRVLLIDPGRSAADAAVGSVPRVASQAHATIAWPTIYRRKDWGADEKLRDSRPRYTGPIQAAFVHHTAGTNDYAPADVPKILRGVYAYHVKGRGWSDIGYNFLVDRFGRAWEGRAGGVDRTVLGAHTGGFNTDSFGISVMGDYSKERPSAETVQAIARVIAWKFSLPGDGASLDPLSIVKLISAGGGTSRYKAGTAHEFVRISGHRDAGRTECPGTYLYEQLPTIRTLVREILDEDSTYGPTLPAPEDTTGTAPGTAPGTDPAPDEGGDEGPAKPAARTAA